MSQEEKLKIILAFAALFTGSCLVSAWALIVREPPSWWPFQQRSH